MTRWPCPVLKYRSTAEILTSDHRSTASRQPQPQEPRWGGRGRGTVTGSGVRRGARLSLDLGRVMAVKGAEARCGFWTLRHHLLLMGAQHDCSWTALPAVLAAMKVSMDLGLFNLPLLWLSPLAGELQPRSCSCPCCPARTETEPVPHGGHAWDHAGTRAVVAAGVVCSAWSGLSVPPAKAAPGWKPLMLLLSREGQPHAVASVCPGAWGTRSTTCLQRACTG